MPPDEQATSLVPFQEILNKDYVFINKLGEGAFGSVHEVKSLKISEDSPMEISTPSHFAAKIYDMSCESSKTGSFLKEAVIMKELEAERGFPQIEEFRVENLKEVLIMSLLSPNLCTKLKETKNNRFSLKTVLMIGYQAIERLEVLHSKGYVHRDIKPENFVLGDEKSPKNEEKTLHLIDFGLSCSYLDAEKKHISFDKRNRLTGTVYFLSVFGHLGIQATRRDDLISLGFMLVHLFKGELPWLHVDTKSNDVLKEIYRLKATTPLKELCEKLPEEFVQYFEHVLKLKYSEEPDYKLLKGFFKKMMRDAGVQNDGNFDWYCEKGKNCCGIDLSARKITGRSPNLYMKKQNLEAEPCGDYF